MKKTILGTVCLLALTGALAYADDDFGSDFGSFGDSDFGSDSFGGGDSFDSDPTLTWSGETGVKTRTWFNTKDGYDSLSEFMDSDTDPNAYLKLDLDYSGSKTDINVKLKADTATIKDHPEDILEEATARGYFGNFTIEAGKMKNVWGKGDKIHVLDNFNANDYTDFVFPDYIDRRIAEPMVKVAYAIPNDANIKIEGVYTPTMTPDRFASSGRLMPFTQRAIAANLTDSAKEILAARVTELEEARMMATLGMADPTSTAFQGLLMKNAATLVKYGLDPTNPLTTASAAVANYLAAANTNYINTLSNVSSLASSTDDLYVNTKTLRYGQAGVRFTGTFGGFDVGASYYYGHKKQPSFNGDRMLGFLTKKLSGADVTDEDKFLDYDTMNVFGLEMATVIWKFNTRWEFAYNMTNDLKGDDPWVHNNSISWVGGFDIDIPLHNLNLNVQETGTFVLGGSDIDDNAEKLRGGDVDYNTDNRYISNKLIVLLKDTFLNEKLSVELMGIWEIENKGVVINPKVDYNVIDGLSFNAQLGFVYSGNENGEFFNFVNSTKDDGYQIFAQLGAKYRF